MHTLKPRPHKLRFGKMVMKWIKQPSVAKKLNKTERALELGYIDLKQAEVNRVHAESIAILTDSLTGISDAAYMIGSILYLKKTDNCGKAIVVSHTLTQEQLNRLRNSPSLLEDPQLVLKHLNESRN